MHTRRHLQHDQTSHDATVSTTHRAIIHTISTFVLVPTTHLPSFAAASLMAVTLLF